MNHLVLQDRQAYQEMAVPTTQTPRVGTGIAMFQGIRCLSLIHHLLMALECQVGPTASLEMEAAQVRMPLDGTGLAMLLEMRFHLLG